MAEPKEEKEIKYGKGAYLTEMDHHPGEDAMLKGFQIGGQTFIAGGVYGAAIAALFEPPTGMAPLLYAFRLIGINAGFYGGVGATFAITTTLATKIRDKDDHKSWGIGGAAAGSLLGFRYRSWAVGCRWAFLFGVLASAIKYRHVYREPFIDHEAFFWDRRADK
eukprot:Seg444.13 transcript_id=Seg444.13/GoldUCD/mRNA.D3Y31 product="NADH dehydrogenase" protein_id=Seg444.13/GoldUCD/D3Y31